MHITLIFYFMHGKSSIIEKMYHLMFKLWAWSKLSLLFYYSIKITKTMTSPHCYHNNIDSMCQSKPTNLLFGYIKKIFYLKLILCIKLFIILNKLNYNFSIISNKGVSHLHITSMKACASSSWLRQVLRNVICVVSSHFNYLFACL